MTRAYIERKIFKNGSTTYYFSSLFFPRQTREDVYKLYSFVRVADDYVDQQPAKPQELRKLREMWDKAIADDSFDTTTHPEDPLNKRVIKNIVHVARKYSFEKAWVDAFLNAMQSDLDNKVYYTLQDTLDYMYGSAEVIGLMMAKIMKLPEHAYEQARLQGRAMQYINFIRDINEDNQLKRLYFPAEDLKKFGLPNLQAETVEVHSQAAIDFIQFQLKRYVQWQYQADDGLKYIPRRFRIPLKTAISMYNWTAEQIKRQPLRIYKKKIKPSRVRVMRQALRNMVSL